MFSPPLFSPPHTLHTNTTPHDTMAPASSVSAALLVGCLTLLLGSPAFAARPLTQATTTITLEATHAISSFLQTLELKTLQNPLLSTADLKKTASPACSKAYAALAADAGYVVATGAVVNATWAVGVEAAVECVEHHLTPALGVLEPLGAGPFTSLHKLAALSFICSFSSSLLSTFYHTSLLSEPRTTH